MTSYMAHDPMDSDDWFVDSVGSAHMTFSHLINITESTNNEVVVADCSRIAIETLVT